jgi:hypothetical protein
MCFDARGSRSYGQRKLKCGQCLGVCDMAVRIEQIDEPSVEIEVRFGIVKIAFRYPVEDGKVRSRVLLRGCFSVCI